MDRKLCCTILFFLTFYISHIFLSFKGARKWEGVMEDLTFCCAKLLNCWFNHNIFFGRGEAYTLELRGWTPFERPRMGQPANTQPLHYFILKIHFLFNFVKISILLSYFCNLPTELNMAKIRQISNKNQDYF